MKLTILGAGIAASQLSGIPNRHPPAFLVEWACEKILFDCSEGVRFRLAEAGYDYSDIHHIAVSHAHPDHCAIHHFIQSVFVRGFWQDEENIRESEITIYCPRQVKKEFYRVWNFHNPDWKDKTFPFPKVNLVPMSSDIGASAPVGDNATLTAWKVYHGFGKVDALGFRLMTPEGIFAYSGDTGECPGIRRVARGADIFVSEASARIGDNKAHREYGHLNPYDAGLVAKEERVKRLILFHYTGLDSEEEIAEDCRRSGFQGELVIGKDFQAIEI